ncbi:MAG: hypothetical protein J2P46_13270 [Zavarzinella sp.]|nr:hypothetical protein [Zavarzinella sp.]
MIRVVKPAAPPVLLDRGTAATRAICAAYERGDVPPAFDSRIYAHPTVKAALRAAQHGKCAFCESLFTHTGFGDVEHFRPKAGYQQREGERLRRPGYYWLAYDWDNLFYSCQLCNELFKRNYFPLKRPGRRARSHGDDLGKEEPLLIHPSAQDPAVYIGFRGAVAYAIRGRREGKATIAFLGLNRDTLVADRERRLEDLQDLLDLRELLRAHVATAPTSELAERLRRCEDRLRTKARDDSEYAAMVRAHLS